MAMYLRDASNLRNARGNKQAKMISAIGLILAAAMLSPATAFTSPNVRVNINRADIRPMQLQVAATQKHLPSRQNQKYASSSRSKNSSLQMAAAPVVVGAGLAAFTGAISGGLFSGSLHAIAGPDHLAALLPRCCGQRWYRAGRIGALWGMGHGMSATLLGMVAFGLKSRIQNLNGIKGLLHGMSSVMEIAVGASLILIGILGIREAREWQEEMENATPQSLSAAAAEPGVKSAQKRAVIFNGILHGFSWDGAPSLAPALAVATWRGNIAFLLAYAMGTMGAMAITTTIIGEGTRRAGEVLERPDIPQKLSMVSSVVAIIVGTVW
eukprot:CAMPEP_0198306052 /NCGR_PEP_ID=MMETSP1449-20131203/58217_1 /TAXON_ID=420275 /ORGANISM="Attheya septentrionalis, Strain CCMP2084" /LENGTH=324 /DNA_ID=CAMNT_0044008597 /DNA_START=683 /DNA_END=1654 /DNA_ORIENTATION=+